MTFITVRSHSIILKLNLSRDTEIQNVYKPIFFHFHLTDQVVYHGDEYALQAGNLLH
jgi:hypothetical protein